MSRIHVGIGGWTYAPWRNNFYPSGLQQRRELEYASRCLTAIEINGTYYGAQKPATYAKWRDETPDGFVFSLKAPRYTTDRSKLADAGKTVNDFIFGGLAELGTRLGPLLWQLNPGKQFDATDIEAFLELLPRELEGFPLRHVLEVRHPSFQCENYLALMQRYRMASVFTDSPKYPSFADITGEFVYARLMRAVASVETGYEKRDLEIWTERVRDWSTGGDAVGLPRVRASIAAQIPRDVFVYFINGAKERAPHAALRLLDNLRG